MGAGVLFLCERDGSDIDVTCLQWWSDFCAGVDLDLFERAMNLVVSARFNVSYWRLRQGIKNGNLHRSNSHYVFCSTGRVHHGTASGIRRLTQTAGADGAAVIHDLARMNGRYCFAGHVHYGSSSGAATQAKAKAEAIESWFELVDLEYGAQWSSYSLSAAKNVKCSQSGTAWGCEVHAIPCSR